MKIESYINNLHPRIHKDLYKTLEHIFERFVPLFNKTLTAALYPRPNRIYDCIVYPEEEKTEEDFANEDEYSEWYGARQPITLKVPEFQSPPKPETLVDLKGRRVQVITKLANIHLTPAKSKYNGGVWHVEGMDNERIIATGIYYYDNENISKSRLQFRQAIGEPDYEQYDDIGVKSIYGLSDEDPMVQNWGGVVTKEDRCIVFPNLYQHKVQPFMLANPKKPGHRKILCFFLVDPATPILSTAQVPPQQADWFTLEVDPDGTLPKEIQDAIDKGLPTTLAAAKSVRRELMRERKYYSNKTKKETLERPFSLCEH